jgi:predicted flap endonuclease-1-like 5' DNA nuclease
VNRRTAFGLLLFASLVLGGRMIRQQLMLGPDRTWREPGWLASRLPQPPEAPGPTRRPLIGKLSINTSPPDSLIMVPGIGPVLAGRISEARTRGVHFACPGDLCRVQGIGPILSERLAQHLRFELVGTDSSSESAICDTSGVR